MGRPLSSQKQYILDFFPGGGGGGGGGLGVGGLIVKFYITKISSN